MFYFYDAPPHVAVRGAASLYGGKVMQVICRYSMLGKAESRCQSWVCFQVIFLLIEESSDVYHVHAGCLASSPRDGWARVRHPALVRQLSNLLPEF